MADSHINKKIAIVTGASSGLGKEFASQIEKSFYLDEIWLIARRTEPMKDLSEKFLKSKGVILSLNLTDRGDMNILHKKMKDENPDIVFLVNNAGYGKIGPFAELGLDEQLLMIDLNIRALTHLTKIVLPFMKPGAKIVQVASSIGFAPAPFFSVYAATKAYVVSFSEALNYELRNRNISVTAVCPGPVATEFHMVAQKNESMKDKVADADPFNKAFVASAQSVVAKALNDMTHKKRRSVYGLGVMAFTLFAPFMPRKILLALLARRHKEA